LQIHEVADFRLNLAQFVIIEFQDLKVICQIVYAMRNRSNIILRCRKFDESRELVQCVGQRSQEIIVNLKLLEILHFAYLIGQLSQPIVSQVNMS